MDRAARHVAAHCKNVRDLQRQGLLGFGQLFDPDGQTLVLLKELELLTMYVQLEERILSPQFRRPKPPSHLPNRGAPLPPVAVIYSDQNWLPAFEIE